MPLVVPGVTNQTGDKTEEWMNKLAGKKLHDGEETNETVSQHYFPDRALTFRSRTGANKGVAASSLPSENSPRSTASSSPVRW